MLNRLLDRIHQFATLRNVLIFIIADLIMMFGVMPYCGKKISDVGNGLQVIDLQIPTYSAERAYQLIEGYGEQGRELYQKVELIADSIYPILYGIAYALLIALLFDGMGSELHKWKYYLPLMPLLGMTFDFLENAGIVFMLSAFPREHLWLASLTAKFSLLKWICAFASILLILIGLGTRGYQKISGSAN